MAAYRRAQHKQNNRAAGLVVALLLGVLALVVLLAVLLGPAASQPAGEETPEQQSAAATEGPLPGLEAQRQTDHPEEEFHYLLNAAPAFERGGTAGSVYLENCEGNTGWMQVVYRLESGEEVYRSPLVAPGWSVQTDSLSTALEPGEYAAAAEITVYSSSRAKKELGRFEEAVFITVG